MATSTCGVRLVASTVIHVGSERNGAVVATGILRILIPDFLRQLTTFKVPGANNSAERTQALARFDRMFFGTLWEVFVQPHLG
jgi:cholesterol oxidase